MRMIDLICPIGKGQIGMIVAPPKVGKTTLEKLNINNELNLDDKITRGKDNPSYVEENNNDDEYVKEDKKKELDVYDIVLAGVVREED